jgi:hypothetical protein
LTEPKEHTNPAQSDINLRENKEISNRKNELVSPIRNCQGKMTYKMQPLWKQMLGAKKGKA